MNHKNPLVSIGVPVYNAERYLKEALDSLLAQDYPNLEIIISDNASTDSTPHICQSYAAADSRVRYQRSEKNIGALGNFDGLLKLASGKYFMWHAHDDLRTADYVSECVAVLEKHPQAVSCFTETLFIDEAGVPLKESYQQGHPDFGSLDLDRRKRIRLLTEQAGWYGVYGLMRLDALRRTRPISNLLGNDLVLLMELCLLGPILKVEKPLFKYRTFQAKSTDAIMKSLDPTNEGLRECHFLNIFWALLDTIEEAELSNGDKIALKYDLIINVCFRNSLLRRHLGVDSVNEVAWLYRQKQFGKLLRLLPFCSLAIPDKLRSVRESNEARLVQSYRQSQYGTFLRSVPLYLALSPGKLIRAEAWSAALNFFRRSKPTSMSRS